MTDPCQKEEDKMGRKYFERITVISGPTFQIWEKRGDHYFERLVANNNFREQYGPYA